MAEVDKTDGSGDALKLRALKDRFQLQEEEVRLVNARRGALLAIIFVMGGLVMDWVVFGDNRNLFVLFLNLRVACCVLLMGVLALLKWSRVKSLVRIPVQIPIHLVALLPMLTLHLMLMILGGVDFPLNFPWDFLLGVRGDVDVEGLPSGPSPYYAGLNLNMVGAVLILRWRASDGVINALLCIGGYLAVSHALGHFKEYPADVLVATFFLFVTAVFACAGLFFYNRLRFAEFCLREEVLTQQEELAENHRKLQELDETKTRFFANISHELRTPLTLILAPIEKMRTLDSLRNDAILTDMVNSLEDNGMRLLRLINDLLDLVRLDSGEMPVRPERFRPVSFIEGLGRNLSPMADRKRINLSWKAPDDEEFEVFLDRDRLEKIVLNLSVNALKFTPPGGRVDLSLKIEDDRLMVLEVADNGAGMSKGQVASAFERFWQADTSIRKQHRGVGIGLALVKSLTESMGGEVLIKSVAGEGSTFTIRVPLPPLPARTSEPKGTGQELEGPDGIEEIHQKARLHFPVEPIESVPSPGPDSGMVGISGIAPRETVLVAEDEAGLRRFLRDEVSEMGCHVIEACDGAEAWDLARQFEPDLIISDYMMPEMDGITLTQRIREQNANSQVPILLVTAAAEETPRLHALEAGVSDFLTKPFTTAELRLRIRNLLDRQRYQRELGVKNQALNVALEEIKENEARLLSAEKLSSLGRMSAGIVHEVNNPLNYAKTALHTLKVYAEDVPTDEREDFEETISDVEEGVNRVIQIVSDLRSFTKGEMTMKEEVRVAETIEMARRLVSEDLKGIEFHVDLPKDLTVCGNSSQLCQVFVNLMQNAAQALEGAGDRGVEPKLEIRSEIAANDRVLLTFRDNGPGIAPEDLTHIFDPFFTRREVGEGMGLGLSICHRILESHQGRIDVESVPGQFTEFSLTLPQPWGDADEAEDEEDDDEDEDEESIQDQSQARVQDQDRDLDQDDPSGSHPAPATIEASAK